MRPYQNYQRVDISTADPLKIVVLLYEGAIRNLNVCLRLFGQDNEQASVKLLRTLEIINYLRNALDHQQGGEVSNNLERLYEYMRDVLNEANIHRDTEKVAEVINLLQILLEGWRGISSNQTAADDGSQDQHAAASSVDVSSLQGISMVG